MGMYIAAFPCNQFDLQEPAKPHEILNGIKYVRPGNGFTPGDNLHIYGKLEVNGKGAHPMYKFLKKACPATGDRLGDMKYFYWDDVRGSDIVWNFEKFIIDRQGRPRYRFHPAAWDNAKFVEKYMLEFLIGSTNDANAALPVVQSPSNASSISVFGNWNTSAINEPKSDPKPGRPRDKAQG
jgi:glutathione peroxidase-family protein